MINVAAAIDLIEMRPLHKFVRLTGRVDQRYLVFRRIDAHQGEL